MEVETFADFPAVAWGARFKNSVTTSSPLLEGIQAPDALLPVTAAGSATSQDRAGDDYEFRSSMCSALCLNWWVSGDVPAERIPADFPFAWARQTLEQYLKLRPFYYGDYYPLTPYSQARDVWLAYQLDRPEQGEGLIVALRRPDSPYETARLALRAALSRRQPTS